MTVKPEIQRYLSRNGRSRVSEIANGIDYHPDYVRKNAKELVTSGKIDGEKVPTRVPAAEIHGEMEVLSDSREHLLSILRKHAPGKVAKAKKMSTNQIRDLIEDLADRTFAFSNDTWEFW